MIFMKNISPCWESTAINEEDTPFLGIIEIAEQLHGIEDPSTRFHDLDLVIIKPKIVVGAKVFWENHVWRIVHAEKGSKSWRIEIQRKKRKGRDPRNSYGGGSGKPDLEHRAFTV